SCVLGDSAHREPLPPSSCALGSYLIVPRQTVFCKRNVPQGLVAKQPEAPIGRKPNSETRFERAFSLYCRYNGCGSVANPTAGGGVPFKDSWSAAMLSF